MTIRILVNGAQGKMGQITVKTLTNHPRFTVVGQTGPQDDLKFAIKQTQPKVVIDFTRPESVHENTLIILESGVHPVIGTTGLKPDEISALQERAADLRLGGIIAPNFSMAAILMMQCAKEIAKYLNHAEIIEMHHDGKLDSPSGTALRTAEILNSICPQMNQPQADSRETIPGARGARHGNVPIHAIRLPGLLAHQQILFGNPGETLTLRHDTLDRQCFMPGVILASEKVLTLDKLVYGLETIL